MKGNNGKGSFAGQKVMENILHLDYKPVIPELVYYWNHL